MKNQLILLLLMLSLSSLFGQDRDSLFHEKFENGNLNTWIIASGGGAEWLFNSEGKVPEDPIAIVSPSDVGDAIDTFGVVLINPSSNVFASLTSPFIDCSAQANVFLRFNQYYAASGAASPSIEILIDGVLVGMYTISENALLQAGEKTTPYNVQEIDITGQVAGQNNVQIRFVVEGMVDFWILDDIMLFSNRPAAPTSPLFGDSLSLLGKPYDVISPENWPYVPNQIVVDFVPGTTFGEKQAIRNEYGFALIDSCVCNTLELWTLDGDGNQTPGFPINERVMGVSSKTKVNSADLNKFNAVTLQNEIFSPLTSLPDLPDGITDTPPDAIVIAVLDTGIDFAPGAPLTPKVWKSTDDSNDGIDQDNTCYPNDFIGWNFVHKNNNPSDDHSHGTHVAGIIAMDYANITPAGCDIRILPVKTHDEDGASSLFNVACGTYYAIKAGADIINDSWGAYGKPSKVLADALKVARDNEVLIVTSAGNDGLWLGNSDINNYQYPACYSLEHIITVGSYETDTEGALIHSDFSNYDEFLIDILAPGRNIFSYIPGGTTKSKTGTSQSTPAVTAALAYALCEVGFLQAKQNLLACVEPQPLLPHNSFAVKVLDYSNSECLVPSDEVKAPTPSFDLYPNPSSDKINIISHHDGKNINLQIFNLSGSIVYGKQRSNLATGETIEIPIDKLPSGMYFVQVSFDGFFWVEKFLKQ